LANFLESLQDISQLHAERAAAIGLNIRLYKGQSLHLHDPPIPFAFTEELVIDTFKSDIFIRTSPVMPSSIEGRNLLHRTTAVHNNNNDRWFEANPAVYSQHASRYAIGANPNQTPTPAPGIPAPTVVYESLKDRSAKHNIARARAITQLLLAREGINANGNQIIIPGAVSTTFEDANNDTAARAVRYVTEIVSSIIQAKSGNMDSLHGLMA
jgi:hypothetical protein